MLGLKAYPNIRGNLKQLDLTKCASIIKCSFLACFVFSSKWRYCIFSKWIALGGVRPETHREKVL